MAWQATVGDALIFMTKAVFVAVVVIVAPFAYMAWSSNRASLAERQLEATRSQLEIERALSREALNAVEILTRAVKRSGVQLTDEEFQALGWEADPFAEELARPASRRVAAAGFRDRWVEMSGAGRQPFC
jgi:hypothetical protein